MKALENRCQDTIEERFGDILCSGQMTIADRTQLRAALLNSPLNDEHLDIINRLIYSAKRGRVKLLD
ncbi:hypothetical protein [Phormidium sp. CCY1219]|uniref:hypothetical protein n=1 Tax=Phormidium sp. CCY1219 TaxID=2886104 RepID=UPI002D1F44DA|nr:hypothetical protein [Phormidium sp. CCY1219]MEB3828793.1 hypothetical protein [Phormidium sp. CCY1219]